MRTKRLTIFSAFVLSGFIFCGSNVKAQESVSSTIKLSDKLNEIGMYDLSFYLLDTEMTKHPQERDKFIVQKAATYFRKGKVEEGEKLLNSISSTSQAYPFSRIILGIKFVNQGDNQKAAKILEEYFAYMKTH
jgi:DNA polymerase III epsilon subunit-like protein